MAKTKKQKQVDDMLFMALAKKDNKSAAEALKAGADVQASTEEGWGVMHFLAYTGNVKMLEAIFKTDMLRKKVQIECKTQEGTTPLIIAASRGNKEVCAFLIEQKAQINHQDKLGQTALLGAVDIGDEEIVRMLLSAGADLSKKYIDKEAQSVQNNLDIMQAHGGEIPYEFDILGLAKHKAQTLQSISKSKAQTYMKMLAVLEQAFLEHSLSASSKGMITSL